MKSYASLLLNAQNKRQIFLIDPGQNAWKSFVSEPLFFHWSCIGFSGSFVFFYRKDMSQKHEVLCIWLRFGDK
ncbi:MAG TPA: hypothetical protein DEV72_23870 [Ktedonobacter sp.]|nr:hypothetical protein [Ktedonobacter sp.]